MGNFIQKAGPFILIVFFGWYAWSAYGGSAKKAAGGKKRAGLSDEYLVQRKSGETLPPFTDPFYADWTPYGPEWSDEAISERKRRAEEERKRKKIEAREAEMAKIRRRNKGEETERPFEPFVLQLQSIFVFDEGPVARISEYSVRVGDKLKALDPQEPPVVVRLDNTSAEVKHRGKKYALDLYTRPEIVVDPRKVEAEKTESEAKAEGKPADKADPAAAKSTDPATSKPEVSPGSGGTQ